MFCSTTSATRRPLRRGVSVLCFALLLAACSGGDKQGNLPTPQGNKPAVQAAVKAEPQGFVLASARSQMYQGQLALVLEFSQRLAGAQAFDGFLSVTGAKGEAISGSWALDEDGKTLRFPYVQADQTYSVHLKGEIAAADGKTLGAAASKDIYTGPLEPAIGFASQGSVLPARETRGLPMVSVNVKEVDVEFLHVRDKELSNFFASYQHNAKRSGWELDNDRSWYGLEHKSPITSIADSVYANRFALSGKDNERTLSYLPIQNINELAEPGIYFAVMKRAGSFQSEFDTSFFFVSDIGLHTRAYKDKLFVHAASLKSGDALAGVDLAILDAKGENVVIGKTDGDGNALLDYELKAEQVLTAKNGKDVSVLPFNQPALDLSDFAVAGRKQDWFDVFARSGRDLYRPGETVRLSALLRDYDGKPIKPQPLFVTLKQPDGRQFAEAKLDAKELSYFDWSRTIPEDAPTGKWQVEFRLDPAAKTATQSLTFRIEEFLPERLKLALDAKQPTLKPGEPMNLDVQGDYLYGAPAATNRFTARLTLSADQHPLDNHKDFYFGDPTIAMPKEAKDVVDEKLDEKGHLTTDIDVLGDIKATAPIAAIVSGSVYETGGRTVTRTLKRTVWPGDALVGVRPLFDVKDGANSNARAGFEVMRGNTKGEQIAGDKLKLTVVREFRDFHWTYDKEGGWHFDYTQRYEDIEKRELSVAAGAVTKFDVPVEWGEYRLEIFDPATGLTMKYPFVAGWSWEDQNRGKEARPDKVKLSLDKEHYKTGDTLKVTITPPHDGPGLLLVESDKLLYSRRIDAKAGASFEIPVTAEWERHDVYVSAVVFRGGSAVDKVTPARAVGVAHVSMDRNDRRIEVAVDSPKMMKPETDLAVDVKAPALAGKKAFVTVSAVDVGILNITRFARPDANDYFFAARRLGVDAYDLYGRVIESFDGALAKLRYGGDMMQLSALPQARRPTVKVLTVDLFSGPVALDAQGNAKISVKVPDFNGTLRVTAVVYSDDHYGSNDTETIVRAPLVAEVSTPRVLAPGDSASLTLDLQNFSGTPRDFDIKLAAEKPLRVSDAVKKVKLADGAKSTLSFPLTAEDGIGVGKFSITATSGDLRIERHFEVAVRPAWPAVLRSTPSIMEKANALALGVGAMEGLFADSVTARLTVSSLPPLPFSSALKGLLSYPYGCVEQTTSRAYGVLLLDTPTANKLGVKPLPEEARKQMIDAALSRISSMQIPSGHFSMWGGDTYVSEMITPYVTEFLIDAREAGFAVSEDVLQKALKRLNEDLLAGGHPFYGYEQADHLRFANEAYSAYVLARLQRAPLGTLRALYDNERSKSITALPLVHLGIALSLQGDKPRGEKAIAEGFAKKFARPWYLGDYGSELRDVSLMVALTHQFGLNKPEYDTKVFDLGRSLVTQTHQQNDEEKKWHWRWNYFSTQEQGALARLGKVLIKDSQSTFEGQLTIGAAATAVKPDVMWSREFGAEELRSGVRFTPQAQGTLFVTEDVAGVPKTAPAAEDHFIAIERKWYTLDGQPWTGGALKEGDGLIVGIKLEAREAMPDALLVDLLPGGLEIENFNLTDAKQWASVVVDGISVSDRASAADVRHEEFRDDRYVAALKLDQGQQAHVFYLVRAVSPGTFVVPPTLVEDMYRPEVRGIGKTVPATVKVVEP